MALQLWATTSLGGYFSNNTLSKELRHAAQPLMKFRQFVEVKSGGANRGEKVLFDKISNITTAGGTLTETDTIPSANFTIKQGTATITEYGNSIPYTGKLEDLSEFDPENAIQKVLRNDMAKVLDSAAAAQFAAGDLTYCCSTSTFGDFTTNGTFTLVATSNLNDYHVKNCVDYLRKLNVPAYDSDGNYICIASVNALRGLRDDSNWIGAAEYGDPERLFKGEVGRYYSCRFIEETNYLSNAKNTYYGEAIMFGADAIMEVVAVPEEIRAKVPSDFGRSKALAWYYLGGFARIWDYSTDGEEHVLRIGSAS